MKYTEEELEKALQENPSLARANSKPLVQPKKRRSVNPVKSQTQSAITERDFEAQIKELAKYLGYAYYHTHRSQFSPSGWLDCTFARLEPTPRLVFAELKTDDLQNSQPSVEQYMWLYLLQHLGQEAYLWRPADWPTIVEILR